jgi:hypothetical protein
VRLLELLVVTSYLWSLNRIANPNPESSHLTRDNKLTFVIMGFAASRIEFSLRFRRILKPPSIGANVEVWSVVLSNGKGPFPLDRPTLRNPALLALSIGSSPIEPGLIEAL